MNPSSIYKNQIKSKMSASKSKKSTIHLKDIHKLTPIPTAIKHKLSEKIPSKFFNSLEDIKLFPVFVSKNPFNPPKNIFLVGDAFFAFSPSFFGIGDQ